jgi:hypothetical protein
MSNPTPAQLKAANMDLIPNLFTIVESNGDKVRSWDETTEKFVIVTGDVALTEQLYAVKNSWLATEVVVTSDGSLSSSPVSSTKV